MAKRVHLGIPLLAQQMELDMKVGYRYWKIDEQGKLMAPINASAQPWAPGLNKSDCMACKGKKQVTSCTCGLYAWKHLEGKQFCSNSYFHPETAQVHNANASNYRSIKNDYCIVGSVLLFGQDKATHSQMVVCKFGTVAALTLPPKPDKEMLARAKKAAEFYNVEIVKPEQLYQAAHTYHKENRLGKFYVPQKPKTIYGEEFALEFPWLSTSNNVILEKDYKKKRKAPAVPSYDCDLMVAGTAGFVAPPSFSQIKEWRNQNKKLLSLASEANSLHGSQPAVIDFREKVSDVLKGEKDIKLGKGGIFFKKDTGDIPFLVIKANKKANLEQTMQLLYNHIGGNFIQMKNSWVSGKDEEFALLVWPKAFGRIGYVSLKKISFKDNAKQISKYKKVSKPVKWRMQSPKKSVKEI